VFYLVLVSNYTKSILTSLKMLCVFITVKKVAKKVIVKAPFLRGQSWVG